MDTFAHDEQDAQGQENITSANTDPAHDQNNRMLPRTLSPTLFLFPHTCSGWIREVQYLNYLLPNRVLNYRPSVITQAHSQSDSSAEQESCL